MVYVLLGRGITLPQLLPDEATYSGLARSLAAGDGLTIRGQSQDLRAALWVYAITPAWALADDQPQAYAIAKGIGAAISATVVVPTWFLARRFLTPAFSFAAAVLAVAGTWMIATSAVLTENLAFPLTTAALMALVFVLLDAEARWGWWMLGFALLASWSRLQMGVLFPIALAVLLADAAFYRPDWRGRLRHSRWLVGATGLVTVIGGIAVLADPSLLGFYGSISSSLTLSGVPGSAGKQALAFIAMAGFVPVIVGIAASLDRAAWSHTRLRSLLLVAWIATAGIVLLSGLVLPRLPGATWMIQRYVEYSLPLVFVLAVVVLVRGEIPAWRLAAVTGVLSLLFLAVPDVTNPQEEQGLYGITVRVGEALGVPDPLALALVCLLAGALLSAVVALHQRGRLGVNAVCATGLAVTAVVFAAQDQAGWSWSRGIANGFREIVPERLDWIDASVRAPVVRLVGAMSPNHASLTEFFNRNVSQVAVPDTPLAGVPTVGPTCSWSINASGAVTLSPSCGQSPTRFLLNDDQAKLTFYNQRVLTSAGYLGRVVDLGAAASAGPRLKAFLKPPCTAPLLDADHRTGTIGSPRGTCAAITVGSLWLDTPGKLLVRFRGGTQDHQIQVASTQDATGQVYTLPAAEDTIVPIEVGAGAQQYQIRFDWPAGPQTSENPELLAVTLVQGDQTQQLLY